VSKPDQVRLQVLMRPRHRNERDVDEAMKLAAQLGLEPSGKGQATFSARASVQQVERLCGSDAAPRVPEALRELVESITVAPQHQRY
jgi:hypothetical protein